MTSHSEKSRDEERGPIVPLLHFVVRDLILIVALILIGLIPFGIMLNAQGRRTDGRAEAVLTVAGEEVWRYSIEDGVEPAEYTADINGLSITASVDETGAWVSHSDCPDRICVHTGKISKVGQTVVCVPFRAVLRIEAANSDDTRGTDDIGIVDAVAG